MKMKNALAVSILFLGALFSVPFARARAQPPIAGVDRTTLGEYRALAQVAFDLDQKKDYANAAKVARVLMLVWAGQEDELKPRLDAWRSIDTAMDAFAKPLVAFDAVPLDQKRIEAAYTKYLAELQKADQSL
jgi:hypothetical protein